MQATERDGSWYLTAGSYEGHIFGYRIPAAALSPDAADEQRQLASTPAFALRAHDGCVRAIASGGALLATSGSDHAISIYNLRKLREHGKLIQQTGGSSLHCLAFFGSTHLLSGGGDGELCIWRSSDWECLLRTKGHKGAVHAIAIHPTGRAALSVAADSKLMLWNLTTGKCNYTTALAEPSHLVAWSPDGESYLYAARRAIHLFSLRSCELLHTLPHEAATPLSTAFATDGFLLSGDDAGSLQIWSTARGTCLLQEAKAHTRRVKAMTLLPTAENAAPSVARPTAAMYLATASSDSTVTLWSITLPSGKKAAQPSLLRLFSIETRQRITALSAGAPNGLPAPTMAIPTAAASADPPGSRAKQQQADDVSGTRAPACEPPDEEPTRPREKKRKRAAKRVE